MLRQPRRQRSLYSLCPSARLPVCERAAAATTTPQRPTDRPTDRTRLTILTSGYFPVHHPPPPFSQSAQHPVARRVRAPQTSARRSRLARITTLIITAALRCAALLGPPPMHVPFQRYPRTGAEPSPPPLGRVELHGRNPHRSVKNPVMLLSLPPSASA